MATILDHCRRRRTHAAVVAAFLIATWTTAMCMAEPISVAGSQGFGDVGSTAAVSTNDVNTATSFDFGNFLSTGVSDGYFAGLPTQLFGTVSFSIADPLSLSFGNATFGQFDSTSIMELSNDPLAGSRSFMIRGTYTAGSFQALSPSTVPADFTVSFNQVVTGATISSNSTLAIQAVPEPGTLGLAAAAIVAAAFVHRRQRE